MVSLVFEIIMLIFATVNYVDSHRSDLEGLDLQCSWSGDVKSGSFTLSDPGVTGANEAGGGDFFKK